ncbi:MAG: hypothetical protein QXX12_01415 [Nanopusillaceae archaeon]
MKKLAIGYFGKNLSSILSLFKIEEYHIVDENTLQDLCYNPHIYVNTQNLFTNNAINLNNISKNNLIKIDLESELLSETSDFIPVHLYFYINKELFRFFENLYKDNSIEVIILSEVIRKITLHLFYFDSVKNKIVYKCYNFNELIDKNLSETFIDVVYISKNDKSLYILPLLQINQIENLNTNKELSQSKIKEIVESYLEINNIGEIKVFLKR